MRRALRLLALLLAALPGAALAQDAPAEVPRVGEPRRVCTIAAPALVEASGLAASRTIPNGLWSHNDSGDAARLFLFGPDGATLAEVAVEAEAHDWEDVAAFSAGGKAWLLVADTGDNKSKRSHVTLYLIEEPAAAPPPGTTLHPRRALNLVYPGGPADCEGAGVDVQAGLVLLVTKVRHGDAKPTVYSVPLELLLGDAAPPARPVEVAPVAQVDVPQLTTALDVSPDGRTLVVLSYGDAYAWRRGADEPWARALARPPTQLSMPRREQGEALCFDTYGRRLLLTSEGAHPPLWAVPIE